MRVRRQKKFTSLDGAAEPMGDLKSVVLHDMKITHVKSNFPVALGARISAVDDITYSSTGEAFSVRTRVCIVGRTPAQLCVLVLRTDHRAAPRRIHPREVAAVGRCQPCVRVCEEGALATT